MSLFTGQVYIDKSYINFNNFIFAAMDMKWKSSNNIKDDYDILDGYSVNIIQKIQEGKSEYERFLQVEGNIKYITKFVWDEQERQKAFKEEIKEIREMEDIEILFENENGYIAKIKGR